jgi:hypothetical protein
MEGIILFGRSFVGLFSSSDWFLSLLSLFLLLVIFVKMFFLKCHIPDPDDGEIMNIPLQEDESDEMKKAA